MGFATGWSLVGLGYLTISLWGWEFWAILGIAALALPTPLHFAVINQVKAFFALNLSYIALLFLVTGLGGVYYATYVLIPSALILLLAGLCRPTWRPKLRAALLVVSAVSVVEATILGVHVWRDVHHPPDAFSVHLDGDLDVVPFVILDVGPFVYKTPGVVPDTITLYWPPGTSQSEIERMRAELLKIPAVEGVELCRRCRDALPDLLQ